MDETVYRDKIYACWAGKCLAGAIGMPFEGVPYRPNLTPENIVVQDVPNDDLEMQLIWLAALKKHGVALDDARMGQIWKDHIPAGCDEYSVAIRNLRHGVMPPVSGWLDNCFADGMGATIRSEIWALVFAGRPDAVAHFAALDAAVDHWGDGVWGEVFMALMECHALVGHDAEESIRFALSTLPECRLAEAVRYVLELHERSTSEVDAGTMIRAQLNHYNFTDCVMNLAYVCYALLWGGGDFLKSVLLAVNMGRDTDCTAATVGAFLGACHGSAILPKELLAKLNDQLALSPYVQAVPNIPRTLTDTVRETIELHEKLSPLLPKTQYKLYEPYRPDGAEPAICRQRWLVLDGAEHDIAKIQQTLSEMGRCPDELRAYVIETSQIQFDLSSFAHGANTLHLYSFLSVENPPEKTVVSATADVGMTLWLDGDRLLNHHSRQLSIPSFHRPEGGCSFICSFADGARHLAHVQLYNCLSPLKCSVMFADLANNHLDGFRFKI